MSLAITMHSPSSQIQPIPIVILVSFVHITMLGWIIKYSHVCPKRDRAYAVQSGQGQPAAVNASYQFAGQSCVGTLRHCKLAFALESSLFGIDPCLPGQIGGL